MLVTAKLHYIYINMTVYLYFLSIFNNPVKLNFSVNMVLEVQVRLKMHTVLKHRRRRRRPEAATKAARGTLDT